MSQRSSAVEPTSLSNADQAVLANLGMAIGTQIRVDGERGTWKLMGVGRDGSLTVVGGPRRQWRSFRPEWCSRARRSARAGRGTAGRLPKESRGLRRQWRAAQHLELPTTKPASSARSRPGLQA